MSIRKDIKITLYCAQSFDMFTKTEFTNQPINLDLREDGNVRGANETVAKVISLLNKGEDFTAITVHDIALNIIGILIAEGTIKRDNIEVKFYDEETSELRTATYDNQGFLMDWHIGYLSCWYEEYSKELHSGELD